MNKQEIEQIKAYQAMFVGMIILLLALFVAAYRWGFDGGVLSVYTMPKMERCL